MSGAGSAVAKRTRSRARCGRGRGGGKGGGSDSKASGELQVDPWRRSRGAVRAGLHLQHLHWDDGPHLHSVSSVSGEACSGESGFVD